MIDLSVEGDVIIGRGRSDSSVHAVHLAVIDVERQLEERKRRNRPYI